MKHEADPQRDDEEDERIERHTQVRRPIRHTVTKYAGSERSDITSESRTVL